MPNESPSYSRLPDYLVRKRTVNADGTVTLSRREYVILATVPGKMGNPLIFGMRVNTDPDKVAPEGAVLSNVELLVDGYAV